MADPLLIAKNATTPCELLPGLANRHGLITGATGTGNSRKYLHDAGEAEPFGELGEVWAVGFHASLQVVDEVLTVLFGFLVEA